MQPRTQVSRERHVLSLLARPIEEKEALLVIYFTHYSRSTTDDTHIMKGAYVDGFVFPVPKKNVAAYKKMATEASKVWKKFGALAYYECQGEDLKIQAQGGMKSRSFKDAAKASPSDDVWFSFIVYKSRAHRDLVNKKVMAFFEKKYADKKDMSMPFDMKKMAYGGFKTIVRS